MITGLWKKHLFSQGHTLLNKKYSLLQLHPDLYGNKSRHTKPARTIRTCNANHTILQESCNNHHLYNNTDPPWISFPANIHITKLSEKVRMYSAQSCLHLPLLHICLATLPPMLYPAELLAIKKH